MSLLSAVEQAIKSCKAQQAKVNESNQFYREILQTLTSRPKTDSEESECADVAATDTSTSPGEKEDIDLLERALEKALWVRTGTETSKKEPHRNKESASRKDVGSSVVTSKDVTQSSAPSKDSQITIRSTSKSKPGSLVSSTQGSRPSASSNLRQSKSTNYRSIIRKHPVSSADVVHHQEARKLQKAGSASGSLDHISALQSKNKTVKSSMLSGDLGNAAAIATPSSNNKVPFPHTEDSGAHSLLQHIGITSEETTKWKSLRRKQNRLWDEVIALQRKPVPGRSRFMERMRATFPKDQPRQTSAPVNRQTHSRHDLTQHCQTKEVLAKPTPEAPTEREWEAWDRWRPEGGCLLPTGENSTWQDGMVAPLPPTITYTTEAELQELEQLRMRVALLQQEIHLEQALLDTLSPQLSSIATGPGCPSPSMLRDMYSLLGEGGERFPAIVRDTEPD